MATKVVFLLACVIAHVSCGENSLTFVIDDTQSMSGDLQQVKHAAMSIVDILFKQKQSQIEDIVLVTFNDPGAVLRLKTRDAQELKAALDSIAVHRGDDCPEATLTGVRKGLEESRPGSYLYVFSDASAKDFDKLEEVKTLAEDKQSRITFILTGNCEDVMEESFQVYHKLALATNGEVFRISKNDIARVLETVKETIKGNNTLIGSETVPAHTWAEIKFTIDEYIEYVIVSVSGGSVALKMLDRNHQYMSRSQTQQITWTQNVKVLKLANASPGTYTAKVRGSSVVNIKVFGRSDFSFRHGFSSEPQTSLEGTDTQPTAGVETHLLVSLQDEMHTATAEEVELLNMAGRVVMTLPLTRVSGDVYRTEKFLPPNDTFRIVVLASSKNSQKTIRREAKTPVTPIQLARPVIDKTEKLITVKKGASIELHCRASGKPQPVLAWFVQQEGDSEFSPLRPPGAPPALTVAADHAARYKCVATNAAGRDQHELQLLVQDELEKPTIEILEPNHSVTENGTIDLPCRLNKGSSSNITWFFKAPGSDEYVFVSSDEVLRLENVQPSSAGRYKCEARNEAGVDELVVQVVVNERPVIDKIEDDVSVEEGGTVDLHCSVTKGSSSNITWFFKAPGSDEYVFVSSDEVLRLENVQPSSAGRYKCEARNEAGVDELVVQVTINELPVVDKTEARIKVREGGMVDVRCRIRQGVPAPNITWYEKGENAEDFTLINTTEDVVHVDYALDNDYFKCVATNVLGSDEHVMQLDIQVPPKFLNDEHTLLTTNEGASVTVACNILEGNPRPEVTWMVKLIGSSSYRTLDHVGEELAMESPQHNQSGHYVCLAYNSVGYNAKSTEVLINAPVSVPRIVFSALHNPHYRGVVGDAAAVLPCAAVGQPQPQVSWLVDYKLVGTDKSKELYVDGNSLVLLYPKATHSTKNSHSYVCRATNDYGQTVQPYTVDIEDSIDVETPSETQYGELRLPYVLVCPLPYTEPSSVRWFQNTVDLNKTGPNLYFEQGRDADSGNYTCRVSDLRGAASLTVQLIFEQLWPQPTTKSGL